MDKKISVLLCTYNGEDLIRGCLDSILSQNYPNFEILCIDGRSKDKTREIIKEYIKKDKRISLVDNPNIFPEGKGNGKWLGFKKSKGEIIGIIDQDNILQRKDLFNQVIIELKKKEYLGVYAGLVNDKNDKIVVRYVSLFGTDSFFAYRSLDFLKNFFNLNKDKEEINICKENLTLAGGNCFFYRKNDLIEIGGFTQDVLILEKLVSKYCKIRIINNATKHYAEKSMFGLLKKKFKWGNNYFNKKNEKFSYFPKSSKEFIYFSKNLLFNLTIIPNFYYSFIIYKNKKDYVSFLFPLISFFNTLAYLFKIAI